jgi:hypothetical protein
MRIGMEGWASLRDFAKTTMWFLRCRYSSSPGNLYLLSSKIGFGLI